MMTHVHEKIFVENHAMLLFRLLVKVAPSKLGDFHENLDGSRNKFLTFM